MMWTNLEPKEDNLSNMRFCTWASHHMTAAPVQSMSGGDMAFVSQVRTHVLSAWKIGFSQMGLCNKHGTTWGTLW